MLWRGAIIPMFWNGEGYTPGKAQDPISPFNIYPDDQGSRGFMTLYADRWLCPELKQAGFRRTSVTVRRVGDPLGCKPPVRRKAAHPGNRKFLFRRQRARSHSRCYNNVRQ